MDSHKIVVKLFVEDASRLDVHEFVPIFHSWIQQRSVPNHLVIDVSDYAHVHHGPGTLLVCHEANFYTDQGEGRLGLMYARKQPFEGTFSDRLRQALVATLEGCKRLETDPRLAGRIKFKTDEVLVAIHDRLNAPSTPETFNAVGPEIERFFADAYGTDVAVRQVGTDETPFKVEVVTKQSPSVDALLARVAGSVASRA
jgi:hypothetical protein